MKKTLSIMNSTLVNMTLLIGIFSLFISCSEVDESTETPEPPTVTSIQVSPSVDTLAVDTKLPMQVTAYYSDNSFKDVTTEVIWTSSNETAVAVNENGYAVAFAAGTAILTASYEGKTDAAEIVATAVTLESIIVNSEIDSVEVKGEVAYTAMGIYSDGYAQDLTDQVIWKSSNTSVATVGRDGVVNAVSVGSTTISASYNTEVTGTADLKVTGATLTSLSIEPINKTVEIGTNGYFFTVLARFSDGTIRDVTHQCDWSSDLTSVATVSEIGFVKTLGLGVTEITAQFEGGSSTATLYVKELSVQRIDIRPGRVVVGVGESRQFTATAVYSDYSTQDITYSASWKTQSTAIATIGSGEYNGGLLTGVNPGATYVTAWFKGVEAYSQVDVTN